MTDIDQSLIDKGPWEAGIVVVGHMPGAVYIESADFTHDVRLYVSGDFESKQQTLEYAQALAARLNALVAQQVTAEPVVAWRYALDASVIGPRWIYSEVDPAEWREPQMAEALIQPLYTSPPPPQHQPLSEYKIRELVKECGLDWQRGYMPLFGGDPTNRYAVLIAAAYSIWSKE